MVLVGPPCKLVWCEPVEARVWPFAVIIDPPVFDDPARLGQAAEQRLVQQLISELAVKTLDEAVLLRLAGLNVVSGDAGFFLPAQDRHRREFRSIVADDRHRPASHHHHRIEFTSHSGA